MTKNIMLELSLIARNFICMDCEASRYLKICRELGVDYVRWTSSLSTIYLHPNHNSKKKVANAFSNATIGKHLPSQK